MPRFLPFVVFVLFVGACDGDGRYDGQYEVVCDPGIIGCDEQTAGLCNATGRAWVWQEECEGRTPVCVHGLGCVACEPDSLRCQGDAVLECTADGERWELIERCEGDAVCFEGRCDADCALAGLSRSYEGCEYWAATLMNSELSSDFLPAIVVGNGNAETVTVTVTRGTQFFEQLFVPPESTDSLELPWVLDLKNGSSMGPSANLSGAAYHVETSLPVTRSQFNPLQYALPHDCRSGDAVPGDGVCFSYSNDASLLLPVPALTEHYIVMSRPTMGVLFEVLGTDRSQFQFAPSVLSIVNPHETEVTVEVALTAPIGRGIDVPELDAGDVADLTIGPGGVLQLAARIPEECEVDWVEPEPTICAGGQECSFSYCDLPLLDLTGTEITASAPVAVFGAHDCDFIPFNRWACDHLEEQLFPFETWGRRFVVEQTHRENGEPDIVRVLSGADHNILRFEPASVHEEISLDRGEHVEFEVHEPFELNADGPVLVGQFLVGQNANYVPVEQELPPGDPAFALAVPVEQWRGSYNFLAPSTFDRSFVNIVADKDTFRAITVDGESLDMEDWQHVGRTEFVALQLEIEPGPHALRTAEEDPFGVLVYGFGQYTSYMVPGGLNLEQITVW